MISHFNLGTNNLAAAQAFYDQLMPLLGGTLAFKTERMLFYSTGEGSAKLAINTPFDGAPATAGNGSMVAISAPDKALVQSLHNKAVELGGSSDGEPGERMDGAFYAAYFRDPDGNKFGVFYAPNSGL